MIERYGEIFNFFVEGQTTESDRIGSGRVGIYRRGWNEFISRPLFNLMFGVGMMESMNLGKYRHDIHSDYLYLLFSLGPGGLLIYLWIQVRTVLAAFWVRTHSKSEWCRKFAEHVICLNAAAVVVNMISNSYVTRLSPGWIFMGMCGLLLGIEADLRRQLLAEHRATPPEPSDKLTPTGVWSADFQGIPESRQLEYLRGARPGLSRYWKPLNGPAK